MQYVTRYNIVPGRAAEFKQWLLDNHDDLVANAGEGWTYLGTWFTVMGFGDHQAETRYEVDDYGSLDGENTERGFDLLKEWFAFIAEGPGQATSLMKSAADVRTVV